MGVDVDASRTRLVTDRRDVRTAVWMADADGGNAAEVVPMAPFSGRILRAAWAGERFLYDATIKGRAAIRGIAPGTASAEEVVRGRVSRRRGTRRQRDCIRQRDTSPRRALEDRRFGPTTRSAR